MEVGDEVPGRRVSPGGFASQGLQDDDVQVAVEASLDALEPGVPGAGDPLGCLLVDRGGRDGIARSGWFLLELRRTDVHVSASLLVVERESTGEELVEQDPERIDVRPGADALAGELLGGRVVGSEDALARLGDPGTVAPEVGVHELRDPEVEKLGVALVGDEDVVRLDVPVHHEILVGVLDRHRDLEEQADAFIDRESLAIAVLRHGHAIDELHRQPRAAVLHLPAVDEAGDGRVVEGREHLAFEFEAPDDLLVGHRSRDDLHRDPLAESTLDAEGLPDLAEAAATDRDLALDLEVADPIGASKARGPAPRPAARLRDLSRVGRGPRSGSSDLHGGLFRRCDGRLDARDLDRSVVGPERIENPIEQVGIAFAGGLRERLRIGRTLLAETVQDLVDAVVHRLVLGADQPPH